MKKLISVFICAVMVLSLSFAAIAANDTEFYDMGDLNGNEKITAADARLCLRASAKLITLTLKQKLAADVFGTGKITAANARTILRVSAKLEKFKDVNNMNKPFDFSIEKKDNAPEGKDIPFSISPIRNFSEKHMLDSGYIKDYTYDSLPKHGYVTLDTYVILSEIGFDTFVGAEKNIDDTKYNGDFFKNNAVIAMFMPRLSSSYTMQIETLSNKDNEISIGLTILSPDNGQIRDDENWRYVLIEVAKADVLDISLFNYHENFKTK